MKKIIILNKKEGETPLEALIAFKKKNNKYKNTKMTYAGRLDPMARGLLLILAGEEVKKKEKYLALNKEYDFSVLFGFATDTYDILGKITKVVKKQKSNKIIGEKVNLKEIEKNIKSNLQYFLGEYKQKYPRYSSKTVKGIPLFLYANKGEEVDIPIKKVKIKKLKLKKIKRISGEFLLSNILKRIKKVKGDFRQKEIAKLWIKNLRLNKKNKKKMFYIAFFNISCSSGTYVRAIANELGKNMQIPTIAFSIKRTKIGKWRTKK